MYKYLSITENLQEMMVMLKSLPAYTLVFDKQSNLVEINEPALKLLNISNVQEFNEKKDEVFPTQDYIKTIIRELKKGNTVRHAKTLLKYGNDSQAIVELCACMINGCQDLFLFQLFEICPPIYANLGSFTSYAMVDNNHESESSQIVDWVTNTKNVLVASKRGKAGERRNKRLVENSTRHLEKTKYRKLTKLEELVIKLMNLNMSILQIATVTNKTSLSIRIIMRRVAEKQKLNSRKEVGHDSLDYAYLSNQDKTN